MIKLGKTGNGTYGIVYKAKNSYKDKDEVAVKRIVKKNTIILALQNKQKFQRNGANEFLITIGK